MNTVSHKAKEVQRAYQRPAEISNNAIRVGQYQLEGLLGTFLLGGTERKNQLPKYWGSKTSKNIWGACDYNNWQNNQHYAGLTGHQEKEKNSSVICQSSVSIKRLI